MKSENKMATNKHQTENEKRIPYSKLLIEITGKKNEKITKLCALILSNVSLAPASKGCLLPYERDLFIVAATDDSVSKIISNVLGDLDSIVAEALIATAIGLFAAIPAVVAYNRCATDVDRLSIRFETFIEEFTNILQRQTAGR